MNRHEVAEVLAKPISRELLGSSIPARLAYTGRDGAPRAIPIGFWLEGDNLVMATVPASAKVAALRQDPRVAITIDTQAAWPPRVLLIRGTVELTEVDGVPEGYIEASRKLVPAEHFAGWEQGVRGMYDRMTVLSVTPAWAKLLDFETTIPQAVEGLIVARQAAAG